MKAKLYVLTAAWIILLVVACGNSDPPKKDETNLPTVVNKILNAGFEDDGRETSSPKNWIASGDINAVQVVKGGCTGDYALSYSQSAAYKVVIQQTITALENGIYNLEFYYQKVKELDINKYVFRNEKDF